MASKEIEITKETSQATIEGLVKAVSADTANSRIEYSTDGGFSYQPLRFNLASTQIAVHQIIDIVNKNYKVRYIRMDNKSATTAAFGDYVAKVTNQPPAREQTKHKIDYVVISRNSEGKYVTRNLGIADRVSQIEITTRFKMNEPNTNRVVDVYDHSAPKAIQRGHLYWIEPAPGGNDLRAIINSPEGQKLGVKFDWLLVYSPRVYDAESSLIFGNIPKVAILSGKYIVTDRNANKLGTYFFIPPDKVFQIAEAIRAYGGQVDLRVNDKLHAHGIINDLEEIMQYVNELDKLVNDTTTDTASDEQIADAVAKAIQYRDSAVDQLKVLNESIKKAREILNQRAANEAINRLQATS